MVPTFLSQDYLQLDIDFTWLAVEPTIWMQISFNPSVITAWIPTMKNMFDSLAGNFSVVIDAPYALTTTAGKSGLQATAHSKELARSGSHTTVVDSEGPGLAPTVSNHAACTSNELRPGARWRREDERGESLQNLTDAVIITEESQCPFRKWFAGFLLWV